MKKGYTHIAVVLGRSGSFDLGQIDHYGKTVCNLKNIQEIFDLSNHPFKAMEETSLFSAVSKTIDATGEELHSIREASKPEKVIFVIITDGKEKVSTDFTLEEMNEKIERQKNFYNWEFVFLGANQDAMESSQTFS